MFWMSALCMIKNQNLRNMHCHCMNCESLLQGEDLIPIYAQIMIIDIHNQ